MTAYILPDELWFLVFEFCKDHHVILRLVCKKWNELLNKSKILPKIVFTSAPQLIPWALNMFSHYRSELLNVTAESADLHIVQTINNDLYTQMQFELSLSYNTEAVAFYVYSKTSQIIPSYKTLCAAIQGSHLWYLKTTDFIKIAKYIAKSIGNTFPRDIYCVKIIMWFLRKMKEHNSNMNGLVHVYSNLMEPLCLKGRLSDLMLVMNSTAFPDAFKIIKKDKSNDYKYILKKFVVNLLMKAAYGGHLHIIEYLHENLKITPTEELGNYIMEEAIHLPAEDTDIGDNILHEHIIRWLHQKYPYPGIFDEFLFARALRCSSPEFLNWLLNTCKCSIEQLHAVATAAYYNRIDNLRFLHINGIEATTNNITEAVNSRVSIEVIKYFIDECKLIPTSECVHLIRERYQL